MRSCRPAHTSLHKITSVLPYLIILKNILDPTTYFRSYTLCEKARNGT